MSGRGPCGFPPSLLGPVAGVPIASAALAVLDLSMEERGLSCLSLLSRPPPLFRPELERTGLDSTLCPNPIR